MAKPRIESGVELGREVVIWEGSKVRSGARVGDHTKIGRNVYIGPGVVIGANCKIQDHALIYEPAVIGDGVFIGPSCVLTNDKNPRALSSDGSLARPRDWSKVGVKIAEGASIGAGAILIAPVSIGKNAMVGAGAVVTSNVPENATVVGNPARPIHSSTKQHAK